MKVLGQDIANFFSAAVSRYGTYIVVYIYKIHTQVILSQKVVLRSKAIILEFDCTIKVKSPYKGCVIFQVDSSLRLENGVTLNVGFDK